MTFDKTKIFKMTTATAIKKKYEHICAACKAAFQYNCLLKYHIRKDHFNRIGVLPHSETQNVNQVWYERVEDTDVIVEIKKINENLLLIQKMKDGTTIKPTELKHEEYDVRKQYPVSTSKQGLAAICRVCRKPFELRMLGKHFATSHPHLVKKKCESCGIRFKRLMNCVRHICPNNDNNVFAKECRVNGVNRNSRGD